MSNQRIDNYNQPLKRKSTHDSDSWSQREATINNDVEIPDRFDDDDNLYDDDLFEDDDLDSY